MTRENGYNMPPKGLFGKRCRIKHCLDLKRGFVYRIVNDGVKSNTWRELPLGIYGKEPVQHDTFEDVVFVVCDTLIDESSKIEKVALKDIEIIEEEPRWIPVSEGLPKPFSYVNCTCRSLIDDRASWVVETCYVPQPKNSPYSDWGNIPMLNHGECEVVAWMYREIPKPYKAESEVKNESLHDESNG